MPRIKITKLPSKLPRAQFGIDATMIPGLTKFAADVTKNEPEEDIKAGRMADQPYYNPFDVKWGQRQDPEINITGSQSNKPFDPYATSVNNSTTASKGSLNLPQLVNPNLLSKDKKADPSKNNFNFGKGLLNTASWLNSAIGIGGAAINLLDNKRKQKEYDRWARHSRLPDNYYAVNTNKDRGDYDINTGIFKPDDMGYKSKGTQANAYYPQQGFAEYGGLIKAANGVLVPGDQIVNAAFLPDINTNMPVRSSGQPAASPTVAAAPTAAAPSEKVSLSGDFNNYAQKAQTYISKVNPNTDITGEMLAAGAQKAFKKTGRLVPVELALAQLQQEGYLAKGKGNKPQRTKNPFNVGNTDDGSTVSYASLQPGVDKYFDLLARKYLNVRTPEELLNNFVNASGNRYASDKGYESGLKKIIKNINQTIGQNDVANNTNMKIRITGTPNEMAEGGQPQYSGQSDYGLYLGQRNLYKTMAKHPYDDSSNSMGEQKNPDSPYALEAEGGETILRPDGTHMDIVGPRHSEGGVKLTKNQAPEGSFIYSDTKKMKIKDPNILKHFGKAAGKAGGITPADLAKQYDVNKYRAILQDPTRDKLAKDTAKLMIENYERKLAQLALVQESIKGFPQGIPEVAKGLVPNQGNSQQAAYGGMFAQGGMPSYQTGGGCPPGYVYDGELDDCVKLPGGTPQPGTTPQPGGATMPMPTIPGSETPTMPIGLGLNLNNAQGQNEGTYNLGFGAKGNIENGKLKNTSYNASFNFPRLFGKDKGLAITGDYGMGNLKIGANTKFPFLRGTLGIKGGYSQNFNKENSNEGIMNSAPNAKPKSNLNAGIEWNGKIGKTNVKITGNYGNPTPGLAEGGMYEYQNAGTFQNGFDPNDPTGVKKMITAAMNGTLAQTNKSATAASSYNVPTWFKPWLKSNTKAGSTSPTGQPTVFNPKDPNKFYVDYNRWKSIAQKEGVLKPGQEFTNPKEYQNFIYDYVSKKDPAAIEKMWSTWGTTNRGKEFPKDPREAFADQYFGARTAELSGWEEQPGTTTTTTLSPETTTTTTLPPGITTTTTLPPGTPPPVIPPIKKGWTNIDKRNALNAAIDYGTLKKYHGYAPTVQPVLPEFIPTDWRGYAASLQSQQNKAADQLGTYQPGQSMASNLSFLAGQGAGALGDYISKVDQYNASGATAMDEKRAGILNQTSALNAAVRKGLWDEENVYDDRYRTAERLARKGVLKGRNQGEENAAKLYNMNLTESPYYTIDPATQTIRFNSDNARAQWEAETKGGGTDETAAKLAKLKKIMSDPTISAIAPEYREAYVSNLMGSDWGNTPPRKTKKVEVSPVTKGNRTETTTYDSDGNPIQQQKFGGSIGASFVKSMGDWYNKLNYIADPVQRQRTAEAYAHKMHFGK